MKRCLRKVVVIDLTQFGFIPGKSTIDAVFILWRMHEEYLAKQMKLYMCFVDLKKHLTEFRGKFWNGQ